MRDPPVGLLRVLVVDDEPLARRRLSRLLARAGGVEVVGECSDARSALARVECEALDLIFLDVQMPEISGLELLRLIPPERLPEVVFVTAHDDFAVQAFEHGAVDYLLKPFTEERFAEALHRARKRIASGQGNDRLTALADDLARKPQERLLVRDGELVLVIRTALVDYVEASDYYVSLHVGAARHLLRQSMKRLEATLDPSRFARVHRRYLVNLERIEALEALGGGEQRLVLRNGERLPVGPSYARSLIEVLGR